MTTLQPRAGFNWSAVGWGGPDEIQSDFCSYCDAEIPDEHMPLIMWNKDGWCARFCEDCQVKWWGMDPIDREELDDD